MFLAKSPKLSALADWVKDRITQANISYSAPVFEIIEKEYLKNGGPTSYDKCLRKYLHKVKEYIENDTNYKDKNICDSSDINIIGKYAHTPKNKKSYYTQLTEKHLHKDIIPLIGQYFEPIKKSDEELQLDENSKENFKKLREQAAEARQKIDNYLEEDKTGLKQAIFSRSSSLTGYDYWVLYNIRKQKNDKILSDNNEKNVKEWFENCRGKINGYLKDDSYSKIKIDILNKINEVEKAELEKYKATVETPQKEESTNKRVEEDKSDKIDEQNLNKNDIKEEEKEEEEKESKPIHSTPTLQEVGENICILMSAYKNYKKKDNDIFDFYDHVRQSTEEYEKTYKILIKGDKKKKFSPYQSNDNMTEEEKTKVILNNKTYQEQVASSLKLATSAWIKAGISYDKNKQPIKKINVDKLNEAMQDLEKAQALAPGAAQPLKRTIGKGLIILGVIVLLVTISMIIAMTAPHLVILGFLGKGFLSALFPKALVTVGAKTAATTIAAKTAVATKIVATGKTIETTVGVGAASIPVFGGSAALFKSGRQEKNSVAEKCGESIKTLKRIQQSDKKPFWEKKNTIYITVDDDSDDNHDGNNITNFKRFD